MWRQVSIGGGEKPHVSWYLIRRVLSYAKPYRLKIILVLMTILMTSLLGLVTPALFKQLIDDAIPNKNVRLLDLLALGIIAIPLFNGGISVPHRQLPTSLFTERRFSFLAHPPFPHTTPAL